jgi:hypothetical protein
MKSVIIALLGLALFRVAPAAQPKFPLKLSESRRHLVDARGIPFLLFRQIILPPIGHDRRR